QNHDRSGSWTVMGWRCPGDGADADGFPLPTVVIATAKAIGCSSLRLGKRYISFGYTQDHRMPGS
ncbi:MAG TPA: hypothetical protein PKY30_19470, partial [Myxococcota bacterium]|nr:hypothetical protein [Myxococcota bacterium]